MVSPAVTRDPTGSDPTTGSNVNRTRPERTTTTGRSAITFDTTTVPARMALTGVPGLVARSTPRCAGSQLCGAGAKARVTTVGVTGGTANMGPPHRGRAGADKTRVAICGNRSPLSTADPVDSKHHLRR